MRRMFLWQLFMLLMTVCAIKTTIVHNKFKRLEPGKNITGIIASELSARSKLQCSGSCLGDNSCDAYQYKGTGPGNCIFIQKNCTDPHRKIFQPDETSSIYEVAKYPGAWKPSSCWRGPSAALYESFDSSDGYVLMERDEAAEKNFTVHGKVNLAWTFNGAKNQWVDLGTHNEACITRPDTCGIAGGAISLWVNILDQASGSNGIVSSCLSYTSGFFLFVNNGIVRAAVRLKDGVVHAGHHSPPEWYHVVLNYLGPNDGEGIRLYLDGSEVAGQASIDRTSYDVGDGRVVVGRTYTNEDDYYGSIQVDELLLFNQALSPEEIGILSGAI